MITFGNLGLSTEPTRSGRSLAYVDVTYNGEIYHWAVYITAGANISTWLTANASVIEQDIVNKEALWASMPHTEEVIDEMTGQTVVRDIPKERIVCATIPDYLEQASDPNIDLASIKRLLIQLTTAILGSETKTQQDIDDLAKIHGYYQVGTAYKLNDVFNHEGKLYKVVQAHTSQADWIPGKTPALYTVYTPADVIADWVQPTGAHDAYNIGDKVKFNGGVYESLINANVWSPTAYPAGWKKV